MLSPEPYFTQDSKISDELLNVIAYLPRSALASVVDDAFYGALDDRLLMRLAVLLARKSFDEGGCPIGAVVADSASGRILGKGHNTLVQENHPYNHGETSAIRDAGRIDFSDTTIYTSLSPCDVCASLICLRGFTRVVVGDMTNASGNEEWLRSRGVQVDLLEDPLGVSLYEAYRQSSPELHAEDWRGLAFVRNPANDRNGARPSGE